jgi:hypothetical protein
MGGIVKEEKEGGEGAPRANQQRSLCRNNFPRGERNHEFQTRANSKSASGAKGRRRRDNNPRRAGMGGSPEAARKLGKNLGSREARIAGKDNMEKNFSRRGGRATGPDWERGGISPK